MKFLKKLPLFIAIIAGIVGAVFRGHELLYCYDGETYLYTWDNASWTLIGIGAVMTFLFLVYSLILRKSDKSYMEMYGFGVGGAAASVFSGMTVAIVGVLDALSFVYSRSMMELTFGALTAFAGICFIIQSAPRKSHNDKADGFWFIVPIFWACYFLIKTFMEHPVEPVLQVFAVDLLSVAAILLAVYGSAAKMFTKNKEKLTVFASLMAIMLIIAAIGGRAVAAYYDGGFRFVNEYIARELISVCLLPLLITNADLLLSRLEFPSKNIDEDEL